jgi:hypothetical protein
MGARARGHGGQLMTMLTFLIPVRHPNNSPDWSRLKANLEQTIASIAGQDHNDWRAVIIANEGSDLPSLPERFEVEAVDFSPNMLHEMFTAATHDVLDAFRFDKGRRVLRGMLRARDSRFFMIVDDDDFVSARLTRFVADHSDSNGWKVDLGYVWDDGGRLLLQHNEFNRLCGTSLIIRADHYDLPPRFEDASSDYIKDMLGGHRRIAEILARQDKPLASLPFRGAIYRVGHSGSHSRTPRILRKYFLNSESIRRPSQWIGDLGRIRFVNAHIRREFYGRQYR